MVLFCKRFSSNMKGRVGFSAYLFFFFFVMCEISPLVSAQQFSSEDFNFGFFMVRTDEQLEELPLVYSRWVRMAGVATWGLVEREPASGEYDFLTTDPIIQEAKKLNLQVVLTVNQYHDLDSGASQKALPSDMEAYKAFLSAFVERYDGDGIDDAPSSPVIKYWQVGNEPDNKTDTGEKIEWNDTPENYAWFLKESAGAIRGANSAAVILIGGLASGIRGLNDFYTPVFTTLATFGSEQYFDIFDVHWFGGVLNNDYLGLDDVIDEIKSGMNTYGYDGKPIWITETATYSGAPLDFVAQTEEEQTRDLSKRLIHYRSLGVPKVFWTPFREFHGFQDISNGYFDNTGLINNPLNDGVSSKKKSYFMYRFLADKLDGAIIQSDSSFMQQINSSFVKGCEFTNHGRNYYALWIDDEALAGMHISRPVTQESFTVYTLMPDVNNEIPKTTVQVVNGNFEYTLGVDPILMEFSGDGPALKILSPEQGTVTNDANIEIVGVTNPLEKVVQKNLYDAQIGTTTADANGGFTFSSVILTEGQNTFTIITGAGEVTRSATVQIILDTKPPAITVDYPASQVSLNTPTISVTGTVDLGQEVVFENPPSGKPLTTLGHVVNGSFAFSAETFPEGLNTIKLSAQDTAGNLTRITVKFRIDTQLPEITSVTVLGDTENTTGPYQVDANITDNDQVRSAILAYTINGGSLVEATMNSIGGNVWRGFIPGQSAGTSITYYVKAVDLAVNVDKEPLPTNPIKFKILDRIAPVISNTTVLKDTNDTLHPYVVTAKVSDNTTIAKVALYYSINGLAGISVPMSDQGGGVYQGTIPPQPLNTLVIYFVRAEDSFHNISFDPVGAPKNVYWFRVVNAGTGDVYVDVNPVKSTVLIGSNLEVNMYLKNLTIKSVTFYLKTIITFVSSGKQQAMSNSKFALAIGASKTSLLKHSITSKFSTGNYTYTAIASDLTGVEIGRDSFSFTVVK